MQRDRPSPDDPRAWLRRAESNLIRARQRVPRVYLEGLCFDAQQAAEKAIKALLIHMNVRFPYTHDLADLLTRVDAQGVDLPAGVREAAMLTEYAVATRYPGLSEPVTDEEYAEAMATAARVVQWVADKIEGGRR